MANQAIEFFEYIKQKIDGNKVYIASVGYAFYNLLVASDVIVLTQKQTDAVEGLFIAVFGIALRSAISKERSK